MKKIYKYVCCHWQQKGAPSLRNVNMGWFYKPRSKLERSKIEYSNWRDHDFPMALAREWCTSKSVWPKPHQILCSDLNRRNPNIVLTLTKDKQHIICRGTVDKMIQTEFRNVDTREVATQTSNNKRDTDVEDSKEMMSAFSKNNEIGMLISESAVLGTSTNAECFPDLDTSHMIGNIDNSNYSQGICTEMSENNGICKVVYDVDEENRLETEILKTRQCAVMRKEYLIRRATQEELYSSSDAFDKCPKLPSSQEKVYKTEKWKATEINHVKMRNSAEHMTEHLRIKESQLEDKQINITINETQSNVLCNHGLSVEEKTEHNCSREAWAAKEEKEIKSVKIKSTKGNEDSKITDIVKPKAWFYFNFGI